MQLKREDFFIKNQLKIRFSYRIINHIIEIIERSPRIIKLKAPPKIITVRFHVFCDYCCEYLI